MTLEFFNRPKNPKNPPPNQPPMAPIKKSSPKKALPPKKGK